MISGFKKENAKLKNRYDYLAKHYNERLHELIPQHTKILDPFIQLLNSNFSNPKVIDLGCGVGLNSLILEKNNIDVLGLDYSKKSIDHAILNCPNSRFIHADFLDWGPGEKFHGVVAGSFLDKFHPDLLPEIFTKIDSLLYPKGYGLVYVPISKEQYDDNSIIKNCKHVNPYTALIERDAWFQKLSNHFKVVNYFEGYGSRNWFISIFQKI